MKRTDLLFPALTTLLALMLSSISALHAQPDPPNEGFTYQAVARNLSGSPIVDQPLTVRIGIRSGSLDGELVWGEEHQVETNHLGLFTLTVGGPEAVNQAGTAASFGEIDWSSAPCFLRVSVRQDGEFIDMGGSPIQTVPMASYATSAKNAAGNFTVQPASDSDPGEALFEVKRKDGQPVFAVYEDMVWVYTDPESAKGVKGGFAVGGYNRVGKGVTEEYMRVTADSVRVYIDTDPDSKGVKGGFAVGGYNRVGKGPGDEIFSYISGSNSVDLVKDKSQMLWYPLKEAFQAGRISINSVDSVGQNSMAMGYKSVAMGDYSQAFGYQSYSLGNYATAFGKRSVARGENSYALGSGSRATAERSFAIGVQSTASGFSSVALGTFSDANADYSTSIGYRSEATGLFSHSFGIEASALGERSVAIGLFATAEGDTSISIGSGALATGASSVALGNSSEASGKLATSIGYRSQAHGMKAISIGAQYTKYLDFILPIIIIPPPIFPKGGDPGLEAPKDSDPTKGGFVDLVSYANRDNEAIGEYSMAIGNGNHAENGGIALGVFNDAMDTYSTAVGFHNRAIAPYSFTGGFANQAEGHYATAMGRYTSAASFNSFVIGTYNESVGTADDWIPTEPLFQIGNGSSPDDTNDALRINKNGSAYFKSQKSNHGIYLYGLNNYYNGFFYNRIESDNTTSSTYGIYSRVYSLDPDISNVYSGYFSSNLNPATQDEYRGLWADYRSGDAIDLAEYIYDTNGDTGPGDVLVADPGNDESVLKSQEPYQTSVVGVVSTDPHMVMGMELVVDEATGEPIPGVSATRLALTGRVPVKVTGENGAIEPGDLLTTSSTPGHAMKWSLLDVNEADDFEELKQMLAENERRRNAVIGKALSSSSSGEGTVVLLISLQ